MENNNPSIITESSKLTLNLGHPHSQGVSHVLTHIFCMPYTDMYLVAYTHITSKWLKIARYDFSFINSEVSDGNNMCIGLVDDHPNSHPEYLPQSTTGPRPWLVAASYSISLLHMRQTTRWKWTTQKPTERGWHKRTKRNKRDNNNGTTNACWKPWNPVWNLQNNR